MARSSGTYQFVGNMRSTYRSAYQAPLSRAETAQGECGRPVSEYQVRGMPAQTPAFRAPLPDVICALLDHDENSADRRSTSVGQRYPWRARLSDGRENPHPPPVAWESELRISSRWKRCATASWSHARSNMFRPRAATPLRVRPAFEVHSRQKAKTQDPLVRLTQGSRNPRLADQIPTCSA